MISLELRRLHDEWGNCQKLLCPDDLKKLEDGTWYRASGECVCEPCGKKYWQHEEVLGTLWLHRLCNGDLVKL